MTVETVTLLDDELSALLAAPIEPDANDSETGPGSIADAIVESVSGPQILLRLSTGAIGVASADEARPAKGTLSLAPGDPVRVMLDTAIDGTRWNVSIGKAAAVASWELWKQRAVDRSEVEGTIQLVVRGGFGVDVEGFRCFLPGRESGIRLDDQFAAVGMRSRFEVTGFAEDRAEPTLSRRRYVEDDRKAQREAALARFEKGMAVSGHVRSLTPFGAFVDIGGIDALLHISDVSLEHVESLESVLAVGDLVEAVVREVDRERGKIAITRRGLLQNEQREKLSGIAAGSLVKGTVTRLADFGAFIDVGDGIEGLCHVSELSWATRVGHPSEVLSEGEQVEVRVLEVDPVERRVALSLRQVKANPIQSFADGFGEGSLVTGTITRIEKYGLFIKVADELEGLCHISDLSWTKRPEKPTDVAPFKVGDRIEVRVLSVDVKARRLKLGLKQVSEDPWVAAAERVREGEIIKATVTRFDRDAAWLQVAEGLEGRMHISEVSTDRVDSIRSALRIGQEVEAMVIKSDATRRRLDLSIRAVAAKAEAETPRGFADAAAGMSPLAAALQRARGNEE
jgi:small subunit ribosomal protein S1